MKGFTLIEVIVSVAIFSVVMVIALGALLTISTSDRKAESIKAVINNLNFAVDSMSRAIRTGQNWGCGTTPTAFTDCPNGANAIIFTSAPTAGASSGIVTYYRLESLISDNANAATVCGQSGNIGCIAKSTAGGVDGTWQAITSPEVVITDYSGNVPASYLFYLEGSASGSSDNKQPKLVITLSGYVKVTGGATSQAGCGTSGNQCSVFHLQTSVEQRIYDQ